LTASDQHLVNLLYKYYIDIEVNFCYYYRYDSWLVQHGYITECLTMLYKTPDQQNRILERARAKAESITGSKLYRAMK
jgi:hypothetical protein